VSGDPGFDYPRLVVDALRGVARSVLGRAAEEGLPGDHHFYVSFRTDAPGVEVSPHLRRQHPAEMTIVLQNQFWGLEVDEDRFAVTLRFGGRPERLVVPFAALVAFADPSADFGLRFDAKPEPPADPAPQVAPAEGTVVDISRFRRK
jgi:hypothetical protein